MINTSSDDLWSSKLETQSKQNVLVRTKIQETESVF